MAGLIERWRERLPFATGDPVVSLGEGSTPLVLAERDDGILGGERQALVPALDQAGGPHENSSSMTRIARGAARMKSSWPISRTAA